MINSNEGYIFRSILGRTLTTEEQNHNLKYIKTHEENVKNVSHD